MSNNNHSNNTQNSSINTLMRILDKPDISVYAKDIDDNFRYISTNELMGSLYNVNAQDCVGLTDYELFDKSKADFFRKTDCEAVKKNTIFSFQHELIKGKIIKTYKLPITGFENHANVLLCCSKEIKLNEIEADENLLLTSDEGLVCTSQINFCKLFDVSPDAIYIDLGEKVKFINSAGVNLWGASTSDNIIGRSIYDLFDKDIHSEIEALRSSIKPSLKKQTINDKKIVRFDGSLVDVDLKLNPFSVNGELHIQVLVHDISEKKLVLKESVEHQRMFASLVTNIQDVVFRCKFDKDRTMTYVSRASLHVLGYSPTEIIDNRDISYYQIVAPEYREYLHHAVLDAINNKTSLSIEYEIICKSGERKWVWEKSRFINSDDEDLFIEGLITDISENKNNRALLKASEFKYRILIENMKDVAWLLDPETYKFTYISPTIEKLLDYSVDEMLQMSLPDIIDKGNSFDKLQKTLVERFQLIKKNGTDEEQFIEFNVEVKSKNGSIKIVELLTRFYKDVSIKKIAIHGIMHDITMRVQNERMLIEAKDLAEGNEQRIKELNHSLEVLNEELKNSNKELVEANSIIESREILLQQKNEEYEAINEELRLANEDMKETQARLESRETILKERNDGYEAINDELRQTNEYLVETKERVERSELALKEAQSLAKFGNWEYDIDKNIFSLSKEAARIFNVEEKNFTPTLENLLHQLHPDDVGYFMYAFRNHITYNEPFDNLSRLVLDDGTIRYVKNKCKVQSDTKGDATHVFGVVADVSERINSENELREAKEKAEENDKLKSAFLANMSHEIRTPLNAIIGFSDLLYESVGKDINVLKTKVERYSLVINRRGNDLLNIINDILDISKIQANQMVLNEKSNNINEMLEEVFEMFLVQDLYIYKRENVDLKITSRVPFDQEFAILDEKRIKQVIINLISNALKFTTKGSVSFGAYIDNTNVAFFVEDTGIGIASEDQQLILEPFCQLNNNPDKKNPEGTGLGLSICTGFARLMQGDLKIESREGEGSTFTFIIPYRQAVDVSLNNKTNVKVEYNWENKTILIVEDDEYCSDYLVEILSLTNVNVVQADTVRQAIAIMKNRKDIDLILMDIRLPDGDGNELTKTIKKQNPNIKIIAQTANAMENDRAKSLDSGCDDYIAKPIKQLDLLQKIGNFFI